MRRNVLGAAAIVLAIGAVGCGESDAPTKAQFAKQANAICARAVLKVNKQRAGMFDKALAYEQAKVTGMRGITPPSELQTQFAKYTHLLADRVAYVERFSNAIKHNAPVKALSAQGGRLQQQEHRLSRSLGITACTE